MEPSDSSPAKCGFFPFSSHSDMWMWQRRAGVALVPLGHERDGVALLPGDLLRRVFVNRVPVGHLQRLGVAQSDLLLSRSPFALRRLDRHAGALEVRADRADEVLFFRALEDVVILDHAADRRRR